MYQVIDDMAMLTASSQLRSSGRQHSAIADELIAFGQNDQWQDQILKYTLEYSHQIKKDYMLFLKDFKEGRFKIPTYENRSLIKSTEILSEVQN